MSQQGPVIVVEDGKVIDEGAHLAPTPSWFKNLMVTLLLVMLCFGPLAFGAVEP